MARARSSASRNAVTAEVAHAAADLVAQGLTVEQVAAHLEVEQKALTGWPGWDRTVKKAEADLIVMALARVMAAPKSASNLTWFLEKRFPKQFGKSVDAVTISNTTNTFCLSGADMKLLSEAAKASLARFQSPTLTPTKESNP